MAVSPPSGGAGPASAATAKANAQKRLVFEEKQRQAKDRETAFENKLKAVNQEISSNPEDAFNNYRQMMVVYHNLELSDLKCELYRDSSTLRGPNPFDEKALNEARGHFSTAVLVLEKVVGRIIDADQSELAPIQATIKKFNPARALALFNKFNQAYIELENCAKERNAWYQRVKWNLNELEGRFTSGIKNMVDIRLAYEAESKPYLLFGGEIRSLFSIVVKQMEKCGENFRNKYNLSNEKMIDDLRTAIQYLEALRRILLQMNRHSEAERIQEKYQIWQRQMEADLKKKDRKK